MRPKQKEIRAFGPNCEAKPFIDHQGRLTEKRPRPSAAGDTRRIPPQGGKGCMILVPFRALKGYKSNHNVVYSCQYHVAWTPKSGAACWSERLRNAARQVLRQ